MTAELRDSLAQVQELKPCPFCGYVMDDEAIQQKAGFAAAQTPVWEVCCGTTMCNASVTSVTRESAITAWNTRHGAGDADRSAELTTAWMAGAERERDRAARDAEDAARLRHLLDRHLSLTPVEGGGWDIAEYSDHGIETVLFGHADARAAIDRVMQYHGQTDDAARAGERG